VVAYELLAGAKPYRLKRHSAAELEEAIAAVDAPLASATATDAQTRKELKGDLDAILNKALKKNASERYATVDALAQDVERYLAGQRVVARPDSVAYRLTRFARRYRTPLAAAAITLAAFGLALGVGATALVILALLLGLGAALWQTRRARAERDRARSEQIRAEQMREFLMQMLSETEPWPGRENEPISALDMVDRGVDRAAQVYARDPRAQADILVKLASVYQRLSHTPRSVRPLQQAIRLLEAQGRPADPTLHEAKAYLANDFLIRGDEQTARSIWRQVLAECDGNDEQSWQVRGYAHYSLSCDPDLDVGRAREHVEQALHAYSLGFGAINEATYQPLERLAQLAVEAGDVTAAESALDRMDVLARHIPQKTLELERAETVRAEVDAALGRYRTAHERLSRLLAASNTSRPAYLISSALIQQSMLSCALGLPERGLTEALRAFAESPGAAPSRRHLKARLAEAIALALLTRHEEAHKVLDDVNVQARCLKLGEGNAAVLALRRSSVRLLAMRGEFAAAEREAQALLTDIVRIRGKDHVEYPPMRLLQAIVFLALGDSAAAAVGAEEVLAMAGALANPGRPVALRAVLLRALAGAPAGVDVQAVHAAARRLESFIDPASPLLPKLRALPGSASNDERVNVLLALL
jgi:tetratricopeptide (TPR) repeat protein